MDTNNYQLKIKNIIQQLLAAMDFLGEVNLQDQGVDFFIANIQSADAAYLIGRSGENLRALQHLGRAITNKQLGETVHLVVDVNNYQANRLELLKEMALSSAKEVAKMKQPQWLAPMNAYERRVIHLALAGMVDIKTESEGEGQERRVVIKPA